MAEQEEDFSSLPLPERFIHKNWKARKGAYETARQEFEKTPDESAPIFRPFLQDASLMKGAVADSNVAAQQEGLAALCAFLKYGSKEHATRTRGSTVAPIVEKGLASTRPAAKKSAQEALLLYIEVDKADPVVEEMLPTLSHKQPKLIAATLASLTNIFHEYGVKIVDPKPVLKALPKVFGHADKNVRAEASNLVVELYRWLREAIKPLFWNDLKPVQQQDLEKLFDAVKQEPPPKQERLLRSQQAAPAAVASAAEGDVEGEDEAADEGGEADVFDLADPIDVYSKMPANLQESLASSKWKDRKEALDSLYEIINVPKIKDGPYDELVSSFAKCMKDANIAVVTVAANCVSALAKGLRKSFSKYRGKIMSPMFERLKEKKQSVADALGGALDAVFTATSLSDCLDETLEFLKHKNPQVKLETLRFLIRCLKTTREAPSPAETKAIAEAATKLLTESTEVTRSGGAEILGTLMKIMGERAMTPFFDGLDDIRKTKIKEFFDVAEVKAKNKPKPAAAPPKAAAAAPAAKKTIGKKPPLGAGAGLKKPTATTAAAATRAISPPQEPVKPATSGLAAPKSISRPAMGSKLAGPSKTGLGAPASGLKPPNKRLAGPGGAAPPVLASPKRTVTPQTNDEGGETPAAAPRIGLGRGGGLTGRTLAKPAPTSLSHNGDQQHQQVPAAVVVSTGLGAIERAELEELRAERERLAGEVEAGRVERARLEIEISELRTHEAELIEERTRNRLTIKAKETQLVRARSDAELAEETVAKQQREMDRLKRELTRAVRPASPPPRDISDQIFRDAGGAGGGGHHHQQQQYQYANGTAVPGAAPPSYTPADLDRYETARAGREVGYQRARSYMTSPSEEKENGGGAGLDASTGSGGSGSGSFGGGGGGGGGGKLGGGSIVRGSPVRLTSRQSDYSNDSNPTAAATTAAANNLPMRPRQQSGGSGEDGSTPPPAESWRRAAEVTSQLRARIEQMKARQGLTKH